MKGNINNIDIGIALLTIKKLQSEIIDLKAELHEIKKKYGIEWGI